MIINNRRLLVYVLMSIFLAVVNFFLRPYSAEMTVMGIKAERDDDVVLGAYMINWMLLLIIVVLMIYTLKRRKRVDLLLYALFAVVIGFVFYWRSFL
jgi:hypothetical protein